MCLCAVLDHIHCNLRAGVRGRFVGRSCFLIENATYWEQAFTGASIPNGKAYWTTMQRQGITPVGVEAPSIFVHVHEEKRKRKKKLVAAVLCSQVFVKEPRRHIKEETDSHLCPMRTHPSIPQGENRPQCIYLQPKAWEAGRPQWKLIWGNC